MHKKLILLLSLLAPLPTNAKSLLTPAQQEKLTKTAECWAEEHQSLDPFSLQLMGNFLYFSYRQTILDELVCRQSATLTKLLKKTMHHLETYENPKGATTLLAFTIHQFRTSATARYEIYMSWKHCRAYLEEHGNETVQMALEQIQRHGKQLITAYAYDHRDAIDQSIQQTESALETEQTNIKKSLNALRESLGSVDSEFNNAELIILDFALKTCNQVGQSSWNILNGTQEMRKHQQEILTVSKELFFAYYKALYKCLDECDEQYQMILFSPRGFLIKSDQTRRLEP